MYDYLAFDSLCNIDTEYITEYTYIHNVLTQRLTYIIYQFVILSNIYSLPYLIKQDNIYKLTLNNINIIKSSSLKRSLFASHFEIKQITINRKKHNYKFLDIYTIF